MGADAFVVQRLVDLIQEIHDGALSFLFKGLQRRPRAAWAHRHNVMYNNELRQSPAAPAQSGVCSLLTVVSSCRSELTPLSCTGYQAALGRLRSVAILYVLTAGSEGLKYPRLACWHGGRRGRHPPIAFKPARELEGEILLDLGRGEAALIAASAVCQRSGCRQRRSRNRP